MMIKVNCYKCRKPITNLNMVINITSSKNGCLEIMTAMKFECPHCQRINTIEKTTWQLIEHKTIYVPGETQ